MAWVTERTQVRGRVVLWIDNGIPIFCEYDARRVPAINREWIDTLSTSAATNYGLQVTPEGGVEALPPTDELPPVPAPDVG